MYTRQGRVRPAPAGGLPLFLQRSDISGEVSSFAYAFDDDFGICPRKKKELKREQEYTML